MGSVTQGATVARRKMVVIFFRTHKIMYTIFVSRYHYTKPFRENEATTVGILFDGIEGTITYYKDGKSLGVAFRGLNEVKDNLYPIICSTAAKTEMTLTGMKRDYVNLQDRCRAVIVKRVRARKDLEKLMVPPRIKSFLAEAILENAAPFKPLNKYDCINFEIV